jgi:hypothetical protein
VTLGSTVWAFQDTAPSAINRSICGVCACLNASGRSPSMLMMSTPVTGGGEGVGVCDGVGVNVGVGVGVGVCVGVAVGVWVAVGVGFGVSVGTGEGVSVDARVGIALKMSQAETIQTSWMSSRPSQRLRLRLIISLNSHNLIPERRATPRCCAFVRVRARA